jgi:hypothetical protein
MLQMSHSVHVTVNACVNNIFIELNEMSVKLSSWF